MYLVIPSGVEESLIVISVPLVKHETVRDVSTHSTSLRARLWLDMTKGSRNGWAVDVER
jgi:hypothetical protein